MSSFGTATLSQVWAMLAICAPGYAAKERDHHWCVRYKTFVYPTLPKGQHGKGDRGEVQMGKIRQLVRTFQIEECAKRQLPLLDR